MAQASIKYGRFEQRMEMCSPEGCLSVKPDWRSVTVFLLMTAFLFKAMTAQFACAHGIAATGLAGNDFLQSFCQSVQPSQKNIVQPDQKLPPGEPEPASCQHCACCLTVAGVIALLAMTGIAGIGYVMAAIATAEPPVSRLAFIANLYSARPPPLAIGLRC